MNGFENYWAQIEPAIRDNLPSRVLAKAVLAQLYSLATTREKRLTNGRRLHRTSSEPRAEVIENRKAKIQATWDEETRQRRLYEPDFNGLHRLLTLNQTSETREANQQTKTERRSMERKRKSEAD